MEIQLDKLPSKYLLGKLPSKYEYNPFRDYMNLQSGKEFETYNKGNYWNYAQKYNHQNRQNQEHLYITTIDNINLKFGITRICAIKMAHSYDVTFVKVFIIWPSNDQKKHDTYYTQEVVLYQSDFYHPDNILNNTTTILNNPTTNKCRFANGNSLSMCCNGSDVL